MARLWSSGFELNTTGISVEWTSPLASAFSVQSTTVRSGTYAALLLVNLQRKGVG